MWSSIIQNGDRRHSLHGKLFSTTGRKHDEESWPLMSGIKFSRDRAPNRFWNMPTQMQNLPLDLKRSALYPQHPGKVGRAIQNWDPNSPPPQYLPARYGYRANKIYPETTNVPSAVQGLMQAMVSPLGAASAFAEGNRVVNGINQGRNHMAQGMMGNPVWREVNSPANVPFVNKNVPAQVRETVPAAYLQTPNYQQQLVARATVEPSLRKAHAIRNALNTSHGLPVKVRPW